MLKSMSYLANK